MLEIQRKETAKKYLDDITIADIQKYHSVGMVAVTGNGHIYGFVYPEHLKEAEAMRTAYDALEG